MHVIVKYVIPKFYDFVDDAIYDVISLHEFITYLLLRTESYVAEVMHGKDSSSSGDSTSRIAKFRSAEVLNPYLLACGAGDDSAEMPIKLGE